jgi:SAM-dependent methyltransferase
MAPVNLPLPPLELAMRVGSVVGSDPMGGYEGIGVTAKLTIEQSLPADWNWEGRRALDFGCGAGRVLRHFTREATAAEFFGCDIDEASIAWLNANACPPFHAFVVAEEPGLPTEDDYFDVAWAMSVFTHLTDHWAGWLLELHRVLKPGGHLITTFLGSNIAKEQLDEPWKEDRVGMNVVGAGRPWAEGGPSVFHSQWWLRAHWGRAFEIVELEPNELYPGTQGLIVMRKRPVQLTVADLERPDPEDPRETAALRHNLRQLHAEDGRVRDQLRIISRHASELEAGLAHRWTARARGLARRTAWGRRIERQLLDRRLSRR